MATVNYDPNTGTTTYNTDGTIKYFTAEVAGTYSIVADGAQGGSSTKGGAGGLGAEAGGDIYLEAGARLEIVVGGAGGSTTSGYGAGGGGGSFVLAYDDAKGAYDIDEVIAGGGGGAEFSAPGGGGQTQPTGGDGGGGVAGGKGGQGGSGGYNTSLGYGGGGGGFTGGNGGGDGSAAGVSFAGGNGTRGGGGGGYGGGGGGGNSNGGGYGGGGGGDVGGGGGGGSFLNLNVKNTTQTAAIHSGDGQVKIIAPVCFFTGTHILTARGEVAVEDLAVGDMAVTASGEQRPVRWIGRQEVDCDSHPRPHEVMPVRVAAGALGPNRPARDLWVSPGHALCLDVLGEVLVPASALVNGATVAQVDVPRATYWHVELDGHDVLLADGQPAESYMDCGNRAFFGTGEGAVDPDRTAATPADYCRPFHHDGALVAAVREQLRVRAEKLGWRVSEAVDDDMHLVADGDVLRPSRAGDMARFVVPASAQDVWLVSRSFVPHHVGDGMDGRTLGVMVQAVTIDDGLRVRREVAFDDPLLCVGFHPPEAGFRWTAGRARLPAAMWDGCRDVFFLSLKVTSDSLRAWVALDGLELSNAPAAVGMQPRGLRLVHAA